MSPPRLVEGEELEGMTGAGKLLKEKGIAVSGIGLGRGILENREDREDEGVGLVGVLPFWVGEIGGENSSR